MRWHLWHLWHLALGGLVVVLSAAVDARAASRVPLGAPVSAVAAGPLGVIAATTREVVILDAHGVVLRRLATDDGREGRTHAAAPADPFAISAGVAGDGNFDAPYDADSDIEDAENVTVEWRTRASKPTTAGSRKDVSVVAADGRFVWWGGVDGLWRAGLDGEGPVHVLAASLTGPRALATSPEGGSVAVCSEGVVYRSHDGGTNFLPLFSPIGVVRALAMNSAGALFVLDAGGLWRVRAGSSTPESIDARGVEDVAICGGETLVLASGDLLVLAEAGSQTRAQRRHAVPDDATHLACSADGSLLVAVGARPWTSSDRGRSGTLREALPAVSIRGVSAARNGLWVASAVGLLYLPSREQPASERSPMPRPPAVEPTRAANLMAIPWWLVALPRVDVGFASARSSSQRDVRAFVLLTFALDRNAARTRERQHLLAAFARREQMPTPTPSSSQPGAPNVRFDALRIEEAEALTHIEETSP